MDKLQGCKTKVDVVNKILSEKINNLEVSAKLAELGFVDDALKFYILSQEENLLDEIKNLLDQSEKTASTNRAAAWTMKEASENNQDAAGRMNRAMNQY